MILRKIYDLEPLDIKMEKDIEKMNINFVNAKYIKNLRLEPIDICFTFRSSPGSSLTNSMKNIIGDLGLTLASID